MKNRSYRRCNLTFLLCLVLGTGAHVADSNDSVSSGVGGRWRMLKGEHKQVQMVSEHVRIIEQRSGYFQTTADFIFRNHGPATTVTMGFPEEKGGDAASPRLSMFNFRTWVDGVRVAAKRQKLRESEDEFTALWVKKIRFGRDATRRVKVRYLSGSGGGYSNGDQWVAYDFTGGNWRGKVRQSLLDIQFRPGWYRFETVGDSLKDNPEVTRKGARFRYRWRNWQAQSSFSLSYRTVFPNELALKSPPSEPPSFLAIEPGRLSLYNGIPSATEVADSILWKGRLWVHAQNLTHCEWSEKRKGMILRLGKRACFVSARGAAQQTTLNPERPFWVNVGGRHQFYVPARFIMKKLGGRFSLYNDKAIYKNGRYHKQL